jgi:hypothetical protein
VTGRHGADIDPRVCVVREARGWRAELVEPPRVLCRARTLHALDRQVRKVLGPGWVDYQLLAVADLADDAVVVDADEDGVEWPRPLAVDGALVGLVAVSSAC